MSLRRRLDRVERALPRSLAGDALDGVFAGLSNRELLDLVGYCDAHARGETPSAVQQVLRATVEERCRAAGVRWEEPGR